MQKSHPQNLTANKYKELEEPETPSTKLVNDYKQHKKPHTSKFLDFFDDSPTYRNYTPRPSFFKWVTFLDMLPAIEKINKGPLTLTIDDIPEPEHKFNIEAKVKRLDFNWTIELSKPNPSFQKALFKTFTSEIIQNVTLACIEISAKIFYSVYMGKIISIITSKGFGNSIRSFDLVLDALIVSVLVAISVFARGWFYYLIHPNLSKARFAIKGFLYAKLNSTSLTAVHDLNVGKVLNLMGNDLMDIHGYFPVVYMVLTPYVVIISIYILWDYFGVSSLIGLAFMIAALYLQIYLINLTKDTRKINKEATDERVKVIHEVVEGIRLIKMYTWDKLFKQKVADLREKEHLTFLKMMKIDAIGMNISNISIYINVLLICTSYSLLGHGVLSSEKVYSSMMILSYLSFSLLNSHLGRMAVVSMRIVFTCVQDLLLLKDIVYQPQADLPDNLDNQSMESTTASTTVFKNFTAYWTHDTPQPCLSNINLTFQSGVLTTVIGKIGSGKTSLLLSILQEIPIISGSLQTKGTIAYVEQDPVIFAESIRDNITFGRTFDEKLYKDTIVNCNLDTDLLSFSHGDLTLIGERGINLSGGQKARLSLARAFYSQSDIYLLDDPFSALDSRVARNIFDRTLKKGSMRDKTIILVTHHLHFAKESDHVILMNDGKVELEGRFEELERMDVGLLQVFKTENNRKKSSDGLIEMVKKECEDVDKEIEEIMANTAEKQVEEESILASWSTYKNYFKVKGNLKTFIILSSQFLIYYASMIYFSRFLGYWAEQQQKFYHEREVKGIAHDQESFGDGYYILVAFAILSIVSVTSYLRTIQLFDFVINTNTELHRRMLQAIIRAKVRFFDVNPVGRIINRFSNDLGILDKTTCKLGFEYLDNAISYIALLATVIVINPVIIIPTGILLFILVRIKRVYQKPMVLPRKLELTCKSPILSHVSATIQGLIIVRTYNQGGRFVKNFMQLLHNNIKSIVYMERIVRLFAFVLETLIQTLTISGIWLFIILMFYYNFESSLMGLCLMYLLRIGDQGSLIIRQSIYMDINMQSAQRVNDYCYIENEPPAHIPQNDKLVKSDINDTWPKKGEIVFQNVYLKYRPELPLALKGLTLKVPAQLKVACIGRTGAGKSSIIQALFRMVEIEPSPPQIIVENQSNNQAGKTDIDNDQASFIKIDGVDISAIGLDLLRSSLAIIPQTPVIFTDSIKANLDPFNTLNDDQIWSILEEVGLKDQIDSLPQKLKTNLAGGAAIFSTGQKQLICLARAIINQSKVVILDEATANVDIETDAFIQRTIMRKFKECTVLTIAHRLVTIANYDKVVVMDNGRVAEYDSPYKLLVEHIGDEQITNTKSVFAEMVKSTGKGMAKKIFQMAMKHHYQNA